MAAPVVVVVVVVVVVRIEVFCQNYLH